MTKGVRVDPSVMTSGKGLAEWMKKHQAKEAEMLTKFGPAYAQPAHSYSINNAEMAVISKWLEELKPEIMEKQGIKEGSPFYGAIGGGVTYSFLPTAMGVIILAKESTTGKELNVTDALDWFFFG